MKVLVKGLFGAGLTSRSRLCRNDAEDRHRQQRRHDPHAEADARFQQGQPDIKINWVTLEENVLRQSVTTDIATKGGQFDVITIGSYETPIWGKKGWLVPLDELGAAYDNNDSPADARAAVDRRQTVRRAVLRRELASRCTART